MVLDLKLIKNTVPHKRQWALIGDWPLRETLCEVKGHDGCGLGQSTTGVLPERVGLCFTGLAEIQRPLKWQIWWIIFGRTFFLNAYMILETQGRSKLLKHDVNLNLNTHKIKVGVYRLFIIMDSVVWLKTIFFLHSAWVYIESKNLETEKLLPEPFRPWVWHQNPHMFHTELVSSTNPEKHGKDQFSGDLL